MAVHPVAELDRSACRTDVTARFTIERMAAGYVSHYEAAISEDPRLATSAAS